MQSQRATESQKQTIPLRSCGHPFPKALAQRAEVEARGELWFPLTWVSLPQSCIMPGTPLTWILYWLHSRSRPCNWRSRSHTGGSCMHKLPPRDTCFSSTTGLPGPQLPGPHRKLHFSSLRLWDPHCSWAAMVCGVRSHGSTEKRLVSKEELSSTWREAGKLSGQVCEWADWGRNANTHLEERLRAAAGTATMSVLPWRMTACHTPSVKDRKGRDCTSRN